MTPSNMAPSIAPLRNVKTFLGMIEQVAGRTFSLPGMATFYGPSGWGKTTAVTVAGNAFNAYCIQVKDCWTPTYLADAVLTEMGINGVRGGVAAKVDAIGKQLALTDRPLLIDDAQYLLRKRMIELARDIYETSQAPVILIGEEKLPQDLTRWENIHNRMLVWEAAQPCDVTDAVHLAGIYAQGVSVSDDLLEAIVVASGGSIRRVATNLARVQELARNSGKTSASLSFWGNRSFDTGQPPAARNAAQLSPRGSIGRTAKAARKAS